MGYIIAIDRAYYPYVEAYGTKKEADKAFEDATKNMDDETAFIAKVIRVKSDRTE